MRELLLLTLIFPFIHANLSITLDGSWPARIKYCGEITTDDCQTVVVPGKVPGGIYSDLVAANLIPDSFIGYNDIKNRWVGNESVVYTRSFHLPEEFLKAPKVLLVFHGLDTFARIEFNGQDVGTASNMFVRYSFDVTKHLKEGENGIKVFFSSPVKVAEALYRKQAEDYVVPPVCVPKEYNGQCHVNHVRKMQASFAWDWGPAIPSMGIWKSVELVAVNEVLVTDTTVDIQRMEQHWKTTVTVYFEVTPLTGQETINCQVTSTVHAVGGVKYTNSSNVVLRTDEKYASTQIVLNVYRADVYLWWPNGHGNANLYNVTVSVTTPSGVIERSIRVGFRKVELVEEPLEKGHSFYFRINDVPIFAKGSNFIPASVFPEHGADEETIRHLLLSTKEANMNMLRIWGGGVYESDLFYDLADEYGIMIWQDFMFACGMYPSTEEFLQNVKEEVVQNVRRLKNHVSVVIWAGNNENEAALYGNWYGTGNAQVYRDDYVKLYVDVIKKEVEELDTTRPFVVSSPSNGLYTEQYNYTGQNPYSNLYGDVHYYNYLKNGWDINQYPRARFSSEYGLQSLPSIYTITSAAETIVDLSLNSDFMNHRQHLPLGTTYLKNLVSKNFVIPKSNDSLRDLIDFVYLSQINQAVSVRIESEFYLQSMSEVNSIGEGKTMGALYWQLNDVWQAPSWSSIDFKGRWKMLHYYAAEFFKPIIVTTHLSEARELTIYVVSEIMASMLGYVVKMNVYKWDEMEPIYSKVYENIYLEHHHSTRLDSLWLDKLLSEVGCGSMIDARKNCIITLEGLYLQEYFGIVNYVYPTELKNVNLPIADVSMTVADHHLPGKYHNYPDIEIQLTTNNIALFVWLEAGNLRGRFSENGFHMFQRQKKIVFHAQEAVTPQVLREKLRLTTLTDIYNPNRDVSVPDDIIAEIKVAGTS